MKILVHDRNFYIDKLIKDKKKENPTGPGSYETFEYDEKRVKPAIGRNCVTLKDIKFSVIDESLEKGKMSPGFYNSIELDKIKPKTMKVKIRPETKIEQESKKPKKNNDPAPTTYDIDKAFEQQSKFDKRNSKYTIQKSKKVTFTDQMVKYSKALPGVGKYNPEKSLDRTYRPIAASRKRL